MIAEERDAGRKERRRGGRGGEKNAGRQVSRWGEAGYLIEYSVVRLMRGVSSRGVEMACGGVIDVLRRVFTGNYAEAETHARGVYPRSFLLPFSSDRHVRIGKCTRLSLLALRESR